MVSQHGICPTLKRRPKKILRNPTTFWPQMWPSPEPRHTKPNSSVPKAPAPCPSSALPTDTAADPAQAPDPAQAQLAPVITWAHISFQIC